MANDELDLNDDQYNLEDTGADEMDSFDDMDGLDFDSPDKHEKTKPAKNISDHLLKSMGSGISSGIKSALKQKFPAISTAAEEIGGLVEDLGGEADDFRDKASKELRSIKSSTKKLVPHTDKYLPPKLRKKLESATEGWEAEKKDAEKEPSEEDRRNAEITNSINNLTSAQSEMQKARAEEERHNNQVGQVTDKVRFDQTKTLMTSMDMTLKSIDNFSRKVHLEFLKKGLELKYRHLYVAKDTKTSIDKLQNDMLVQLEKIRHNTGLSDFMRKEAGYEERVMGRADIRFKKKMGSFLGDFQKNMSDKIFNRALSGLSSTAQMADMGAESADMMGEMEGMGGEDEDAGLSEGQRAAKHSGGLATKMGGSALGKFVSNKILGKVPTNIENVDDLAKNWQTNTMFWADGMRDKLQDKGGLASMAADLIPEVRQDKVSFEAGSADKLTEEAKFDQAFHRSVTEVIPGFLAKILKSTSTLATGKEQSELAYNYYRNNFTTQEQYRKDIGTKAFGKKDRRMDSVEQTVGTTKGLIRDQGRTEQEDLLDTQTTGEDIRRMYVKMAVENVGFRPDQFRQYFEDEKIKNGKYFKTILPGLEDPDSAVGIVRAAILDKNNQIDRTAVSKIRSDLYKFLEEDTYLETLGGVTSSGGHRFVQDLIDQEGNLKKSSVVKEYMEGDTFKDEKVESAAKSVINNRQKAREERAAALKQANELLAKTGFNTTVEDLSKDVVSKTGKAFHDVYDPMAKHIIENGEKIVGSESFKFLKGTIKEQAVEDLSGLTPDIETMDKEQSRKKSKEFAAKLEEEEKKREKNARTLEDEDVVQEGASINSGRTIGGSKTVTEKTVVDNTKLLEMVKGFRDTSKDQLGRIIGHVSRIRDIMEGGGPGTGGSTPKPTSGPVGGMGFGGMQQRGEITNRSAGSPRASMGGAITSIGEPVNSNVNIGHDKGKEVKKKAIGFGQKVQDRAESEKKKIRVLAGNVRESASDRYGEAREKLPVNVSEAREGVSKKFGNIRKSASGKSGEIRESASDRYGEVREKLPVNVSEAREGVSRKFGEIRESASDRYGEVRESASKKFGEARESASKKLGEAREGASKKFNNVYGWAEKQRSEMGEQTDQVHTGIGNLVGDAKKKGGTGLDKFQTKHADTMPGFTKTNVDLTDKVKAKFNKGGGDKSSKESMKDRVSGEVSTIRSSVTSKVTSSTSGIAEDIRNRIDERLKSVKNPDIESKLTNLRNWMSDISSGVEEVSITKLRKIRRRFMETAQSGKKNAEAGLSNILSKKNQKESVASSGGMALGSGFDKFTARKHDDDEKMITLLEGIMASVSGMGPKKLQQSGILRKGTSKLFTGLGGAFKGLGKYYQGLGAGAASLGVGGMSLLKGTGTAIGQTSKAGYKGLSKLFGGKGEKTKVVKQKKAGKQKKFEDVYLSTDGDFSDPLLTAKKQKRGEALLWKEGGDTEEIKATIAIDSQVIDKETGNFLITQDDLTTGIVTRDGTVISGRGMVKDKRGLFSKATSAISDKVSKKKSKFFDVYEKDNIKPGEPLLSANKQKDGVYFQDGKTLTATWSINGPIFDRDGNALITQENIDNGLVDIHGKPIKSGGGTGPGFLSNVGKGLGSIMSGAGGVFGAEGDILKMLAGGVGHVSKTIFDKLFNKDKNKEGETSYKTYEEVTLIRKILENKLEYSGDYYRIMVDKLKKKIGDADSDGIREGSYNDLQIEDGSTSNQLLLPQNAGGTSGKKNLNVKGLLGGAAGASGGGGIMGEILGSTAGEMGGSFMTKNVKKLAGSSKMKGLVKGLPKAGLKGGKGIAGMFTKLPGMIMSGVAKVMPMLGSMMSGVILPGLLVAGAGIAGWFAGKWLRKTFNDLKGKAHDWLAKFIPGMKTRKEKEEQKKFDKTQRGRAGTDAVTTKAAAGDKDDWTRKKNEDGTIIVRDTAGNRVTRYSVQLRKLKKAGASPDLMKQFRAFMLVIMSAERPSEFERDANKDPASKADIVSRQIVFDYAMKAAKSKVLEHNIYNQPAARKGILEEGDLKDLKIPKDLIEVWMKVKKSAENITESTIKIVQKFLLRFTEAVRSADKNAKSKAQNNKSSNSSDMISKVSSEKKQSVPSSKQTLNTRTNSKSVNSEDGLSAPDQDKNKSSDNESKEEAADPRPHLEVIHEDLVSVITEMRGVNNNTGKLNSLSDEISEKTGQQIAVVNNNTSVQSNGGASTKPESVVPLIDITNQGGLYAG